MVCKNLSKTDFQDGSCGGHLSIDKILANFDPKVVLLLHSKFQLKSTEGLGRDVEILIFKRAAVAAQLSFSYFVSTSRPNAPHQVSTQLDHSL